MAAAGNPPALAAAGSDPNGNGLRKNSRSARWCFTINNPINLQPWSSLPDGVRLLAYQVERGAEGTVHLQGYIAFTNARTFKSAKTFLGGDSVHLEVAQSTEDKCVAYCTKEDTRQSGPYVYGEAAKPGSRSDIHEAAEALSKTGDLTAVPPHILLKYSAGCKFLVSLLKPRHRSINVITLIGPTNIGKTFQCFCGLLRPLGHPDIVPYRLMFGNSGTWFDGYAFDQYLFIDEFKGQMPLSKLLPILDPYPVRIEVKTSTIAARWTTVVIASNDHPEVWYPGQRGNAQFDALLRRLGPGTPRYITASTREELADKCKALRLLMPGVFGDPIPELYGEPSAPAPGDQPDPQVGGAPQPAAGQPQPQPTSSPAPAAAGGTTQPCTASDLPLPGGLGEGARPDLPPVTLTLLQPPTALITETPMATASSSFCHSQFMVSDPKDTKRPLSPLANHAEPHPDDMITDADLGIPPSKAPKISRPGDRAASPIVIPDDPDEVSEPEEDEDPADDEADEGDL